MSEDRPALRGDSSGHAGGEVVSALCEQTAVECAWERIAGPASAAQRRSACRDILGLCQRIARGRCTPATAAHGADADDVAAEVMEEVVLRGWSRSAGRDASGLPDEGRIIAWLVTVTRRRGQRHAARQRRWDSMVAWDEGHASRVQTALGPDLASEAATHIRETFRALAAAAARWRFARPCQAASRAALVATVMGCFDRAAGDRSVDQQIDARCDGAMKGTQGWKRAQTALFNAERRGSAHLEAFVAAMEARRVASDLRVPAAPPLLLSWMSVVRRVARGADCRRGSPPGRHRHRRHEAESTSRPTDFVSDPSV